MNVFFLVVAAASASAAGVVNVERYFYSFFRRSFYRTRVRACVRVIKIFARQILVESI